MLTADVPSTRRAYGGRCYWAKGIINDLVGAFNEFIVSHHDAQLAG